MNKSMKRTFEGLRVDRALAQDALRSYAAENAPHVSAADVDALAAAIGDISFLEAMDAVRRWESERTATPAPAPERVH